MKVEILEEKLSSDGFYGEQGDRFTVPDDVGANWCSHGWAKDLSGIIETGPRIIVSAQIVPASIIAKVEVQNG